MRDLMPPRTFSVTLAGLLSGTIGFYWLAVSMGVLGRGGGAGTGFPTLRLRAIVALVVLGCAGSGALIGGFGIQFRRNWARVLAVAAAGPLIFSGLWDLYVILRSPNLLIRSKDIVSFVVPFFLPFMAAIAWPVLLIGRKVRAEFLPLAMVEIYVNLMNEAAPRTRATQALTLGNGLFELLVAEGYDPAVEHWEFRPGSIVRGKQEHRDGDAYLLATLFER